MKKIYLVISFLILMAHASQAQYHLPKGRAQLNAGLGFSGWGIPVYVGFDYGVHKDISIGGEISFRSYSYNYGRYYDGYVYRDNNYNSAIIGILANGNYHFNSLLHMPKEWDFYAGLNVGVYIWTGSYVGYGGTGLGLGAQVGGRYYFSDHWGINLELGGNFINAFGGGKIGVTYAF